jgi:hypothetical protein
MISPNQGKGAPPIGQVSDPARPLTRETRNTGAVSFASTQTVAIESRFRGAIMNIVEATTAYERWAGKRIDLVAPDIRLKHQQMASGTFPFMRATFYRWAMIWEEICPELALAPTLLAVGDLHVENFGTWRDSEGRLIWGINDFDEAFPMPYTIDLVRLATSALLAIDGEALSLDRHDACAAILSGYRATIEHEGKAFVLEEPHPTMRAMALGEERDPVRFWSKLLDNRTVAVPVGVRKLLQKQLPDGARSPRFIHRTAGMGSLGRPRYVALADWGGGMVAREAKALLPSAYAWANKLREKRIFYDAINDGAIRVRDPFLKTKKGWVLRRLAPHCTRIELADLPQRRDERHILEAMGQETANVHFATPSALPRVRRDLKRRGTKWLHEAASKMAAAIRAEWKEWRAATAH